jgi:cytoskeleton protein RodZ
MAAEDGVPPIPELVHLGERLSKARRERGLSLEELANRLRLGTEQLMALEAGDSSHLPEPVFVVAQAKRVAGALGIDISQQISDLQESRMMREAHRPAGAALPRRTQPGPPNPSLPRISPSSGSAKAAGWRRWPMLLLAGGGLVITVAVLQGRLTSLPTWRASTQATAPAIPPPATPAPASFTASKASAPDPDQLRLHSDQPSWLEVRSSKGVTLFRGTLQGGKSFPMGEGLTVLAGRPDLVTASIGRQQALPLGPIDQVVWKRFTVGAAAR